MNIAVILCGGKGIRMKTSTPKQLLKINEKPLFRYTLDSFLAVKEINRIILVVNQEHKTLYEKDINSSKTEIILGGRTRQESVEKAIEYLDYTLSDDDVVLIHDGARCLIDEQIICENIRVCKENKKPISTAIDFVDTIVDRNYNLIDRNSLMALQTPQTFIFKHLKKIHLLAKKENIFDASDDIQLAKRYNYDIISVLGSRRNIKITEPQDLEILELYLKRR